MKSRRLVALFAAVLAVLALVGRPAAHVHAASTTYYSQGSLAPNLTTSWNSSRGGSGSPPTNFTTAGDVFVIQSEHNMTTTAAWSVSGAGSKLWIENGGALTATSAVTLAAATTFQIDAGGTYVHNNTATYGSTVFQGTESFAAASTVVLNNSNSTGPSAVAFGNLTINFTGDPGAAVNCGGGVTAIKGNLTVQSTSVREFRLTAGTNFTLNLAGNLDISGGSLNLSSGLGAPIINIGGNVNLSAGVLDLGTGSGAPTLTISGNFDQSGGTLQRGGSNNRTMNVGGNWTRSGGIFNNAGITVAMNGTNVQTIGGSVSTAFNNLTINQAGGVTLGTAATVDGLLSFGTSAGLLRLGDFDLTLGPNAPAIGGVFSSARMIVADGAGSLCKRYPTLSAYDFPIGDVTGTADYAPVTAVSVTGSASGSPSICFRVTDAAYPNKPSGATTWITRYWTGAILPTGSSIANLAYGATFNFVPDDPSGGADLMDGKKWDGATWATLNPVSGTSFTGSNLKSLSDFTAYNSSPAAVTLAEFSAAQVAGDDRIMVTWETASELNNRGFNLWRGAASTGPNLKLNATLIPSQSQGLPSSGFQYSWPDSANLVPGTTYYYWIEDLDVNDTLTRHEPVSVTYGRRADRGDADRLCRLCRALGCGRPGAGRSGRAGAGRARRGRAPPAGRQT